MKTQELMLGDWVNDGGESARVTSLTCDGIIETTRRISNVEVTDPIPLTPEILEKSGFEFLYSSVPGGGSLQEQRRKKVDTYKWHGLVINYFHENSDFQIMDIRRARFNYVHELQHALRLCGIEKEINLRPGATKIV